MCDSYSGSIGVLIDSLCLSNFSARRSTALLLYGSVCPSVTLVSDDQTVQDIET